MDQNTLNLILLVLLVLLMFVYLAVRIYFSVKLFGHNVPIVNSANDVISNQDLTQILSHYQVVFGLQNYQIIFKETETLSNLGKSLNHRRKTITFSKLIFPSVGYELDYLIGTLWFISEKKIKKNRLVRTYDFLNRYGFNFALIWLLIFFLLSLFVYLVVGVTYHGEVNNAALQFLWNYPIFELFGFAIFFSSTIFYLVLVRIKPVLESRYAKDLELTFDQNFSQFAFDLKAARTYAKELPLPHNFAFKASFQGKIKWLGPFVKH